MSTSWWKPAPKPPAPRPPVRPLPSNKPVVSLSPSGSGSRPPRTSGGYTPAQSGTRPQAVAASAPRPSSGGGGTPSAAPEIFAAGGGGGGSADIDWRDASYNSQINAINRALAEFETDLGLKTSDYGTDYLTGIRQLGFRPGEGWSANVDIFSLPIFQQAEGRRGKPALPTGEEISEAVTAQMTPTAGQWDYEGEFVPFSAAARGTRTARDEFAGRGTLRSSDFAKAYADFQNRMQEQLTAMETGRGRFYRDAAMSLGEQRAQAEERRQAAQRDAIMRAAIAAAG